MMKNRRIEGLSQFFACLVVLMCIALFFDLSYSLPFSSTILWFFGVFVYFYIPGYFLLRYLGWSDEVFIIDLSRSLALGVAVVPIIYNVFRKISGPELIYGFGAIMLVLWIALVLKDWRGKGIRLSSAAGESVPFVLLLLIVLLILHLTHFTDIVHLERGVLIRNSPLTETVFHLGIVNVMRDTYPPFNPYASGLDFSYYHLFMHHEIEMFNRIFSIDTLKLTFLYFPFLYMFLLVAVPYMFVRRRFGIRSLGIVTAVLVFGSDFSFIPGLSGMFPDNYPWTIAFTTTIWSVFTLNGNLPALFIMLLSVDCIDKYFEDGKTGYFLLFMLLAVAGYGFKSTLGVHLLAASMLTGGVSLLIQREKRQGSIVLAVSALLLAILFIDVLFFKISKSGTMVTFAPLNGYLSSLSLLKLNDMSMVLLAILFPVYVIAMFGTRIAGLVAIKNALKRSPAELTVLFLSILCGIGFILSEFLFIGNPAVSINNAEWFMVQSLVAAWLLVPYYLHRVIQNRFKYMAVAALILALSLPTTGQFLALRSKKTYTYFSDDVLSLARYLEQTPQDSIILHPLNYNAPSVAANLAGRRSVLSPFLSFSSVELGRDGFNERVRDVDLFFQGSSLEQKEQVLEKYNVNFIYVHVDYAHKLDGMDLLEKVYENKEAVVYKVGRHGEI